MTPAERDELILAHIKFLVESEIPSTRSKLNKIATAIDDWRI